MDAHAPQVASAWVVRWATLVQRGPVLDVACGAGRHAIFFAERGFEVFAVDRDPQTIPGVRFVRADLEHGSAWPFPGKRFAALVVTNYLHRPLLPVLAESLDEGGVLIYETFMAGNERYGRPTNPDFLLRPGELLQAFGMLTLVAFEQGLLEGSRPAVLQRVCAVRGEAGGVRIAP